MQHMEAKTVFLHAQWMLRAVFVLAMAHVERRASANARMASLGKSANTNVLCPSVASRAVQMGSVSRHEMERRQNVSAKMALRGLHAVQSVPLEMASSVPAKDDANTMGCHHKLSASARKVQWVYHASSTALDFITMSWCALVMESARSILTQTHQCQPNASSVWMASSVQIVGSDALDLEKTARRAVGMENAGSMMTELSAPAQKDSRVSHAMSTVHATVLGQCAVDRGIVCWVARSHTASAKKDS